MRFYTYVSTLILALGAAAENDLDFVVLDRPNPLGGERIEGPVSAPRDAVPESFVNMAPGPLVHGLTLGEMARYVNAELETPARLTVVPMEGWRRDMTWADTGRRWIPPSPNLRSAAAAIAYPGVALLEATNVNEGRGTTAPFLLLGAPWVRPEQIRITVPGFALDSARFTPTASPAAPAPKHRDQPCAGLRVRVTDANAAQPYRLGVELLAGLSRQPGFEWRQEGAALTRLLGTPRVGGLCSPARGGRDDPGGRSSRPRRLARRSRYRFATLLRQLPAVPDRECGGLLGRMPHSHHRLLIELQPIGAKLGRQSRSPSEVHRFDHVAVGVFLVGALQIFAGLGGRQDNDRDATKLLG